MPKILQGHIIRGYQYYISIDPGLTRFRLAIKSLCVAVITVIVNAAWLTPIAMFIAGLAAATIYSCHHGENKKQRKWTIVITGISVVAMILLGSMARHIHIVAILILILISFCAFYLTKFGERYRLFPVLSSLFYILSVFLVIGDTGQIIKLMLAILTATAIAFIMYVYIWPDQPRQIARHYTYHSFKYIHDIVGQFRSLIRQRLITSQVEEMRPLLKQGIVRSTEMMALIDHLGLVPMRYDLYQRLTLKLYATNKLLAMVWESLFQLSQCHNADILNQELLPILKSLYQLSEKLLKSYQAKQYACAQFDIQPLQHQITAMQNQLLRYIKTLTEIDPIHLYNLIFGLQRLAQRFDDMHQLLVERDALNRR